MKLAVPLLALMLVAPIASALADGTLVGEGAPTFDVLDVTGPHKGEELCYV